MLIHSYIYYELDTNIVSDMKWMQWARELVELQKKHPDESKKVKWYELFKDFDGSTGFHLAKAIDEAGVGKANFLLSMCKKRK